MASVKEVREVAKKLNLQNIAKGVIEINEERVSNIDYLYNVLLKEVNIREENKLKEIRKVSRLKELRFDETKITEGLRWQLEKIKEYDFKINRENIFIVGECGRGKTSLATLIGRNAIEKGAKVIYVTLEELLIEARLKKKCWNRILNSDLVIIDEVFYINPSEEELMMMYKVMMFLQETRSIVLVTNRAISKWKEMNVDAHLIETLSKRLLKEAQMISL